MSFVVDGKRKIDIARTSWGLFAGAISDQADAVLGRHCEPEAKQSSIAATGLLRFARNDDEPI
jgi:hypothetical protein